MPWRLSFTRPRAREPFRGTPAQTPREIRVFAIVANETTGAVRTGFAEAIVAIETSALLTRHTYTVYPKVSAIVANATYAEMPIREVSDCGARRTPVRAARYAEIAVRSSPNTISPVKCSRAIAIHSSAPSAAGVGIWWVNTSVRTPPRAAVCAACTTVEW